MSLWWCADALRLWRWLLLSDLMDIKISDFLCCNCNSMSLMTRTKNETLFSVLVYYRLLDADTCNTMLLPALWPRLHDQVLFHLLCKCEITSITVHGSIKITAQLPRYSVSKNIKMFVKMFHSISSFPCPASYACICSLLYQLNTEQTNRTGQSFKKADRILHRSH